MSIRTEARIVRRRRALDRMAADHRQRREDAEATRRVKLDLLRQMERQMAADIDARIFAGLGLPSAWAGPASEGPCC